MNIGIRLHDTKEGNLYERLGFAKAQGFSCAHLAMSKAIRGFSEQAPADNQQLPPSSADR